VSQDPRAIEVLRALGDESLALVDGGRRAVIVGAGKVADAVTGESLGEAPANVETIVINNRIRGEIGSAIAALKLGSTDRATRLAAARELQGSDNEDALPIIEARRGRKATPRSRPSSNWPARRSPSAPAIRRSA